MGRRTVGVEEERKKEKKKLHSLAENTDVASVTILELPTYV